MPGEIVRTPVDPVTRICQGLLDLTKAIHSLADHVEHMDERLEGLQRSIDTLELTHCIDGTWTNTKGLDNE